MSGSSIIWAPEHQAQAWYDFFKSLVFSCVIKNGDAHLKNFGLLYPDPAQYPVLAPVFDLVCTTAYLPQDHLALSLGGAKNFPSRTTLGLFGKHVCHLAPALVQRVFDEVATGIEAGLDELNHYCRQFPAFATTCGTTMMGTWKRNLTEILLP